MTEHRVHPDEAASERGIPLRSVAALFSTESTEDVYQWGVDLLGEWIPADVSKLAVANGGMLIPTVSTGGGETGREHAIPIETTIPGSVFATNEGCTIPNLEDVRGGAAVAHGAIAPAPVQPNIKHRSMLCAPVGDIGVIVGLATEVDVFEEADLEVATQLGDIIARAARDLGEEGEIGERGATRMLEEIASMVSHDLRNKLNILVGRLDLARETGDPEHFDASVEAIEGVEAISDMIVTLARTGRPLEEVVEIDIAEAAKRAFEPLNTPESMLTIKASATIFADGRCISQLLENLFRNSIEHADGPVNIEVGLLEDGFYIADDGPGISAKIRKDVFDLGFTTAEGHSGKGLSIVQRMADAHGWEVEVTESTTGGARVEVHGVIFR